MHAAFGQRSLVENGVPTWRASFPEPRPDPAPEAPAVLPAEDRSSFTTPHGPNWGVIAVIIGFHAVLLFALIKYDVIAIAKPKPRPLVVKLMTLPPDPPSAPKEPEIAPPEPVAPAVVVPKAVVEVPAPTAAPPIIVTHNPTPPKAVVVAPAAPAAPTGPVSVDDLASKMISAPSPRYPVESRRRKEQGTVFLSVLVGIDGSVAEVAVSRSSGSARLDKAALEAVRRWRWSPIMRGGAAVMVRGMVDIPFVLQG